MFYENKIKTVVFELKGLSVGLSRLNAIYKTG